MTVGQYRTSLPTLTDTQVAKLQLDSAGNLKVVNASSGTSAEMVQGNIASGVADAGNPVKIGGYSSNAPLSAVTDGQRTNAWFSNIGAQASFIVSRSGILVDLITPNVDGIIASNFNGLAAFSFGSVFNGTTWDRLRGDANGQSVQKGLGGWTYASGTTGILSNTTTAVTVKTAAGASVRNFIDSIQLTTTAFTVAGPIAIRDGASGTVIWSLFVPTAGFTVPVTIVFETPLRSTANTLLEIVTTTANTAGTVMVNIQGHTGT